MIRICFYNYGGGELHVSRELEINREVDEYLILSLIHISEPTRRS